MMRTIETKVFTFDDLSPEAQAKAIEDNRYSVVQFPYWWDSEYDYFINETAKNAGFTVGTDTETYTLYGSNERRTRRIPDIQFSGFASQGDGASFTADVDVRKVCEVIGLTEKYDRLLALLREENEYDDPDVDLFRVTIGRARDRYVHEHTMTREVEPWHLDGTDSEAGKLATEIADGILEEARDLARGLYRSLEKEYYYLTSDEAVSEMLRENEVEFAENGKRCICI